MKCGTDRFYNAEYADAKANSVDPLEGVLSGFVQAFYGNYIQGLPVFKPLKRQTKIVADNTLFFLLLSFKEIRLDISCESSARQRIHMKYQVLFSLKNNEKVFINVVCCSRD